MEMLPILLALWEANPLVTSGFQSPSAIYVELDVLFVVGLKSCWELPVIFNDIMLMLDLYNGSDQVVIALDRDLLNLSWYSCLQAYVILGSCWLLYNTVKPVTQ